ncbi:vWA domain-containing protein [Millisia brevis]|uniref:vWA domain-containing protein n=1 Tax=Millisia brevis TaxID=264148 RepID=UPI00083774E3|nr:VWA domain-containing protein [Millisia brevis]
MSPDLGRGANTSLSGAPLDIAVSGARQGTVDLMVFQLTAAGTVRTDADFVFFNQPTSPEGGVRLTAPDRLAIDPSRVPAAIERLAVAVTLDDAVPGSLAGIPGLAVVTADGGTSIAAPSAGLTSERSAVLIEIYRRQGAWKIRNVSAGWDGGFADLVREHGVVVDDSPAPATPAAAPPSPTSASPTSASPTPQSPAPAGGVRSVAGEEKLSLEKRRTLNLRKEQVHKVLLTKQAQHERARIVLVMDKTGSMSAEYRTGVVHRVIEKMVPVAIALDDDGSLEAYFYAKKFLRVPDVKVEYLDRWLGDFVHMRGTHEGYDYNAIGAVNDEIPIMEHLLDTLRGQSTPTLVLFFTDGGFSKRTQIRDLLKRAAELPAFWQFVGIGNNNFGLLSQLDEMEGRVVDNVGFFSVADIDRIDDAELYRRLLGEFPDWLRAARVARILS